MNSPIPPPDDPTERADALAALFAAARSARPDTSRAEYGFETRLLARLASERAAIDGWREFAAWCWRLMPGLTVLTVAFSWWTLRPDAAPADDRVFAATATAGSADDDDLAQWMAAEWLPPI